MTGDGLMTVGRRLRGALVERFSRLEAPRRIPGIDLARALAVVGMFAAHLLDQPQLVWDDPASWGGLVDGRSSILFATLAGVSLALADHREQGESCAAIARSDARIATRALLIWSLGALLVHWEAPVYVILQAYGILFLLAILLLRLSTPLLLLTATLAVVLGPFVVAWIDEIPISDVGLAEALFLNLGWNYPFVAWVAFIAAGIAIGRLLRRSAVVRSALLLGVGSALAVVGYGLVGPIGARADAGGAGGAWTLAVLEDVPHLTGVGEMFGSGGFAIAVIGLCVLLGATAPGRALWPLRALGSMPLTAYVAHLLIWIWWIDAEEARRGTILENPGAAFRELDPFWPMTIGLIVGCSLWALLFGRGPLEAALDRVSRLVAALIRGDARPAWNRAA